MKERWPQRPLKDLCEFRNGLWKGKKPPYLHVGVIRNTNFTAEGYLDDSDIAYLDVEAKQFTNRRLQPGDIILEKSGGGPKQPVGRVILFEKSEGDFSFSNFTSLIRLQDPKTLDAHFLHKALYWHYATGATEAMQRRSTGIRNLVFDDYKELLVPLPPLPEQRRIVGILDEAFAGIARAVAATEKNLANARELTTRHLDDIFERNLEWPEKRLGDLCERVSVGHVGPTSSFYCAPLEGVPFLRSQNVRPGRIDMDGLQYVTREFHAKLKKSQLRAGDLLFVRVGANRGDCCTLPDGLGEINCANIVFARPAREVAEFVELYCQSSKGRARLLGMTTGSAQGVINTKSVAELRVPMPAEASQAIILDQQQALLDETQRLESLYRRKLAALAELKQALLQKAFAGELTGERVGSGQWAVGSGR